MTTGARSIGRTAPASLRDWVVVFRHAGATMARAAALILAVLILAKVRGNVSIYTQLAAVGFSMGCLYVALGQGARSWAFYVVLFVLFAQLRAHADEIGTPVQFDYAITMEKVTFLGTLPGIKLQDAFYTYPRLGVLEAYTMAIYLSYFFVPHIVALALWKWDRGQFRRYVPAFLITLYISLIVCAIVPTAPPWMASEAGKIPTVYQIVPDIMNHEWPGVYQAGENSAGTNAVAAMPSLHSAVPFLLAIALWKYRYARWLAGGYAVSMAFSVVYLGEHYAVDAAAGLATAVMAWAASRRLLEWWDARRGTAEVKAGAEVAAEAA